MSTKTPHWKPTKHTFENFGGIVRKEVPKLDILSYYPYGSKTIWEYWCTGKVDLEQAHKERWNKGIRTEKDYILKILTEVGRAMNYLALDHCEDPFDRQRVEAFALWRLFYGGLAGWAKQPLKGLSEKQKEELYAFHEDRSDKVCVQGKYSKKKEELTEEYKKSMKDLKMSNRKRHGIYEVKYLPLMNYEGKPLYDKAQLAAIWTLVMCYFENLC
jgi:hypothetical protein